MQRLIVAGLAVLLSASLGDTSGGAVVPQRSPEKAGDSRSCIPNGSIVSRIVEDAQTIRFELLGGRIYRNRLSGPCPGLRQAGNGFGALGFELHGSSLCRGDLVRVVDASRGETANIRTATACPLGAFERLPDRPRRRR
jgi:hypothetical protein